MAKVYKKIRYKNMYEDDYPLTSGVERARIKQFYDKEINNEKLARRDSVGDIRVHGITEGRSTR